MKMMTILTLDQCILITKVARTPNQSVLTNLNPMKPISTKNLL